MKTKNNNFFKTNIDETIQLKKSERRIKKNKKLFYNKYGKYILILLNIILIITIIFLITIIRKKKSEESESESENIKKSSEIISINKTENLTNITSIKIITEPTKITETQTIEKRKIYVSYLDFWPAFVLEKFDVHKILLEKYDVIVTNDKPDYVIFSQFGGRNYGIEKKFDCIKIFLTIENHKPNFFNCDYAIGIFYINNGDRYFRKPTGTNQLSAIGNVYNVTKVKGIDIKTKKFCAWVVSNGGGWERNKFFEKLSKYKVVDSGGSYKNNVGGKVKDKLEFLSHYKFSICFENSKADGYISEKLYHGFESGTIPIYFGDDSVLEILNNKSYIHVKNVNEFDEKIELIKKIDQNDTLYEMMIREKIVIDDNRYAKELQKYKDFIYHIIDQDKEKAKRFKRN